MISSNCGKILHKKLLLFQDTAYIKIYSPPLSISWDVHNEALAIDAYIEHKHSIENHSIVVEKCGFIVHPVKGWIGASPDIN